MRRTEKPERNAELYREFLAGMSLSQLAKKYGVSQNRVSGIIKNLKYKDEISEIKREFSR